MKNWFERALPYLIIGISILAVVAVITLYIVALVKYGGKPITEIPSWAFVFLRGGK